MRPNPIESQFSYFLPYGAVLQKGGVRFSVFSRQATQMRLLLYQHQDDLEPSKIIDFDPFKAQKLDKIAYFGSQSPLNEPDDPPVGGLKMLKLLKMVER